MRLVIGSVMATLLALSVCAQTPPAGEVKKRKENQQDRIANGVSSGQLTAKETANLENKEKKLNQKTAAERKANGGNLTNNEKKQINQRQNKLSKQIYDDKHNADQAKFGNNEIGARRQNQQQRVAQGIKSGQMTAGEAARVEKNETKINQQVAAERKANGGNLTNNQKKQANKQLNKESKQIYNEKHN
jgi:hypothetical protein